MFPLLQQVEDTIVHWSQAQHPWKLLITTFIFTVLYLLLPFLLSPQDNFYSGKPYVTLKDKVIQPSSPLRHAAEQCNVLSSDFPNSSTCQ